MAPSAWLTIALVSTSYAWLPEHKNLQAFSITREYDQSRTHARDLPNFPSNVTKVRGVNFGGWLVSEPWMMEHTWLETMGCGNGNDQYGHPDDFSSPSESDCMRHHYSGSKRSLGDQKFEDHWSSWITTDTVQDVYNAGLNTIRIPVPYWTLPDILDSNDQYFPNGTRQLPYLDAVVKKAADLGIYVIIDFHAAPGGQQQDIWTGRNKTVFPDFYKSYNFNRAEKWLSWMTERIHRNPNYKSVGMLEVLNEPVTTYDDNGNRYRNTGNDAGLLDNYYPNALKAIRTKEQQLGISQDDSLHVQFMSKNWIPANPNSNADVKADPRTAFDDHNYIGFVGDWSGEYQRMHQACTQDRAVKNAWQITGEWSCHADVSGQDFFKKFFTAQQQLYEAPAHDDKPEIHGWVWWSWKTETGDPQWDYQLALQKGWIPNGAYNLARNVYQDVCSPYR